MKKLRSLIVIAACLMLVSAHYIDKQVTEAGTYQAPSRAIYIADLPVDDPAYTADFVVSYHPFPGTGDVYKRQLPHTRQAFSIYPALREKAELRLHKKTFFRRERVKRFS